MPVSRILALAASISVGCSNSNGGSDNGNGDAGTNAAASSSRGGSGSGSGSGSSSGADPDSSSGADSGIDSGDSGTVVPPSCAPGGAGMTDCGANSESCCTSVDVPGGTYFRAYTPNWSGGGAPPPEGHLATVSSFRLDKYEVTVGRFRQFTTAWNGAAGYTPAAGSGKHTHLNGGQGLANSGGPGTFEPGWVASDDSNVAPTNTNLACKARYVTWTASAGSNETLPINCMTWYEAYAFCIWDGGFLPSEAEWEYAASGGSQQREYPWGSTDPGTDNQYAIYGDGSGGCYYPGPGLLPCTGVANIAPVGTATQGTGVWGQLDLAGSVNEWNLDWYAPYVSPCADCANLTAASVRVERGGYFYVPATILLPSNRDGSTPTYRSNCLGLRCARTP